MEASLQPVRQQRSPIASSLLLMLSFLGVWILAQAVIPAHGMKIMSTVQLGVITLTLVLSAAWLARSLASQTIPGTIRSIHEWGQAGITIAAFVAAIVVFFPRTHLDTGNLFISQGIACLSVGFAVAVLAALAFWPVLRRAVVLDATAWGTTLGAFAGFAGACVLQYSCDLQNTAHLAVWHGAIVLVSMGAGALAGAIVSRRPGRL